jgi:hypothetical protein
VAERDSLPNVNGNDGIFIDPDVHSATSGALSFHHPPPVVWGDLFPDRGRCLMSGFGVAIDEICPAYVGENRITITLAAEQNPRAFSPVRLLLDFSKCEEEGGIVPPLEVYVGAPSPAQCEARTISSTSPPTEISFVPKQGGPHIVTVREVFHNRWWGSVVVQVTGEKLRMASSI